nr:UDP-N-acetylmuramoyl-tripeptide--D-alanyl-D-alanine ligase [Alphaproteobacteria bacterium]
ATEIAAAIGTECPDMDWEVCGISIDTRTIQNNELFIALKGNTSDGTLYVDDAIAKGAAGAIAGKSYNGKYLDKVFRVDDTLVALCALAAAARARSHAKIIAVTGSVGKTSTKEMLAHSLAAAGRVHATQGNLNNHFGLPLTLARMPRETEFAVLEMGMNHGGEITPLTTLAQPDIAIITNVDAVHLEYFENVGAIADAKAEILAGLNPDTGIAILNRDNPHYLRLLGHAHSKQIKNVQSFGSTAECDAEVLQAELTEKQTTVRARMIDTELTYVIGAPGAHWVPASLAVLLAATALGIPAKTAATQFITITPPKGRGVIQKLALPDGGMITVLDESYNASPVSVAAGLATLGQMPRTDGGRRIAVLGDMLELGPSGPELHRALAGHVVENGIDLLFCAGPFMRELFENTPPTLRGEWAENSTLLAAALIENLQNGDVLLVKGSRGMKMEVILTALSAPTQKASNAL